MRSEVLLLTCYYTALFSVWDNFAIEAQTCARNQFLCKSNECIDNELLCNGKADCTDGSDETIKLCSKKSCSKLQFKCNYGACIPLNRICDNKGDCADKSDEEPLHACKNFDHESKSSCPLPALSKRYTYTIQNCTRQSNNPICQMKQGEYMDRNTVLHFKCEKNFKTPRGETEFSATCLDFWSPPIETCEANSNDKNCRLPPFSQDHTYTVETCGSRGSKNYSICSLKPGELVNEKTTIYFKCNKNFYYPEKRSKFLATCVEGQWTPSIIRCLRVVNRNNTPQCSKLESFDSNLSCFKNDTEIRCDDSDTIPPGTVVKIHCKPKHSIQDSTLAHSEIICNDKGEWSDLLPQCEPDCGKDFNASTHPRPKILLGDPVKYGESPWHVAVYDLRSVQLICGATIISSNIIVSAAHCFYNKNTNSSWDPKFYEIVVSKFTRNYDQVDNEFQRQYKIQKILFPPRGYYHVSTNYESDIALLVLTEEIEFSSSVFPACIQWTNYHTFNPPENSLGRVVGWGVNNIERNTLSETLAEAKLPYISYRECLRKVSPDYRHFIRFDKFCAGTSTGAGASRGDSGGGYFFFDQPSQLFFLRGIVSAGMDDTSIAFFTDLKEHMQWIISTYLQTKTEKLIRENLLLK